MGSRSLQDGLRAFLGWVFAGIIVISIIFVIANIPSATDGSGADSGCGETYEKHFKNAREFGYTPEERSAFINECERSRRELSP